MLQKSQQGLTLLEMLISLFIGIFLLGGVAAAYLAMRTTTNETLVIGELQNTGRLALNIMGNDIAQAGFKGDISTFSAAGMVQTQPAFAGRHPLWPMLKSHSTINACKPLARLSLPPYKHYEGDTEFLHYCPHRPW